VLAVPEDRGPIGESLDDERLAVGAVGPVNRRRILVGTMNTLVPRTAAPYSTLAMISEVAMLPAMRLTKTWPMLWSKTSSTGTRESAQASTEAKGSCFSVVCCISMSMSS
jgi:hypothetical protein